MKNSNTLQTLYMELIPFIFQVFCFWYILSIFLEKVFPGFISATIPLDLFLWCVILLASATLIIQRFFNKKHA